MNSDDMERTPYSKSNNRKIVLVKDFEEDKEYHKARKRSFIRKITVILIIAAAITAVFFVIRALLEAHTYSSIKILEQTEFDGVAAAGYISYEKGVIRYGISGAEYIDNNGSVIWNAAYEMDNPKVFTQGEYVVIADIGGKRFIICNLKGILGAVSVVKTIIDADISAAGAVCVVLDDETANYVNFYDKKGNALDIEIKTLLAGDGYPVDMSLSPNGQLLMMSYLYMNEGIMLNKVVFYNFSELGQNYADRLIGVFNYEASVVPVVEMISDEYACAFAQDKVDFYSLKASTKPALINSCGYSEEIQSVFVSDEYAGVVSSGSSGTAQNNLDIYTLQGQRISRTLIDFDYSEVNFCEDRVVFNNNNCCMIYNIKGSLKFEGALEGPIDFVYSVNNNRLIKFKDNIMYTIKLRN